MLVKNSILNFITRAALLAVLVAIAPFLIRTLGVEAFGLLSLFWALIGYMSFLDLGISLATINYLSINLAKGDEKKACEAVWTSLVSHSAIGLIGSIVFTFLVPTLIRIFKVTDPLKGDASFTFYLVAVGFIAVLFQGSLSSIPSSLQRFDIINLITGLAGALQWIFALGLAVSGFGLKAIVLSSVIIRGASSLVFLGFAFKLLPALKKKIAFGFRTFVKLIRFGGWITITQILEPVFIYLDRILIGAIISLEYVAFYTIPHEAITKLWFIPASICNTLFPALSEQQALKDERTARRLYLQSVKFLLLIIIPIAVFFVIFSKNILTIWIGADFAEKSSTAFLILAVALPANALANIPNVSIQALGRPDISAKIHLVELPLYVGLCYLLISQFGISGAALAWGIRSTGDAVAKIWAMKKFVRIPFRVFFTSSLFPGLFLGCLLFLAFYGTSSLSVGILTKGSLVLSACLIYVLITWSFVLNINERKIILEAKTILLSSKKVS